jgi:hypothetical protein
MGLILVVIGLLVWLLAGWTIVGIVLIVVGLCLMLAGGAGGWYAYPGYRRGPP